MFLMQLLSTQKKNKGFTMLEMIVVLAIIAVILVSAGLTMYPRYRNNLLLDQAIQEISGEIKVVQSRALAVQKVQIGALNFTPKAAIMRFTVGGNPEFFYLRPSSDVNNPCSGAGAQVIQDTTKTINISERARISKISLKPNPQLNQPVYLIYTPPVGRFYAIQSNSLPTFANSTNKACRPVLVNLNKDIEITLISDNREIYLDINNQTGSVTIRR